MQRLRVTRAGPCGGGVDYDDVRSTRLLPLVNGSIEVGRCRALLLKQRGVEMVVEPIPPQDIRLWHDPQRGRPILGQQDDGIGERAAALLAHELEISFRLSSLAQQGLDAEQMWIDRAFAVMPNDRLTTPYLITPACPKNWGTHGWTER